MIAYLITNNSNGMMYVGVTSMTLRRRWTCHRAEALSGRGQRVLCKAIRKYGIDNFSIEALARASSREDLGDLETILVRQYGTKVPNGYNMTDGGHGTQGRAMSEDARRKISLGGKGRIVRPETRERIRRGHQGKVLSAEHRAKLAAAKLGKKMPPRSAVHKQRISEGLYRAHARRKGAEA